LAEPVHPTPPPGSLIRVLVVDDEPAVVETTAALLADDFVVATAASGAEALEQLGRTSFDVICTDYNMPGMTGSELLGRAVKELPWVGGVLVTGYREYSARTDKAHSTSYMLLLKPYEPQKLLEVVRRAGEAARLKQRLWALNPAIAPKGVYR
jgi:DNA-binding NtrC family response regulator